LLRPNDQLQPEAGILADGASRTRTGDLLGAIKRSSASW
jgi:hypothetical protein